MPFRSISYANLTAQLSSQITHKLLSWPSLQRARTLNLDSGTPSIQGPEMAPSPHRARGTVEPLFNISEEDP